MTFAIKIVIAGLAATFFGGCLMFLSFDDRMNGVIQFAFWKGTIALVLGVAITCFGIRAITLHPPRK